MRRAFSLMIMLTFPLAGSLAGAAQLLDQAPPPKAAKPAVAPRPDEQPAPPPGQTAPAPTPRPETRGLPINVRLDVTITDQIGSGAPVQKIVSLLVADQSSGAIRSEGQMPGYGTVQLNVDGEVRVIQEPPADRGSIATDKIRTRIGLNYDLVDPKAKSAETQSQRTQIRESISAVLENGKPTVIAQSADPVTDRKVTVEVKATIIK
jgi:hypothetical protein